MFTKKVSSMKKLIQKKYWVLFQKSFYEVHSLIFEQNAEITIHVPEKGGSLQRHKKRIK